jgi:hypothetical protein
MGVVDNFKRRWHAAAERRRRGRWYFVCYLAALVCLGLGAFDVRFYLIGLLAILYAAFGMIYSDPTSPKSRGAWYFFMLFGVAMFLVLTVVNFAHKPGLEVFDVVTLVILTHIAYSQLALLLRARRQYFDVRVKHDVVATNREYLR